MTIVQPSDDLVAGLKDIGAAMLENWNAKASDDAKAILSQYQN